MIGATIQLRLVKANDGPSLLLRWRLSSIEHLLKWILLLLYLLLLLIELLLLLLYEVLLLEPTGLRMLLYLAHIVLLVIQPIRVVPSMTVSMMVAIR